MAVKPHNEFASDHGEAIDAELAVLCARMFFVEGRSKVEIAEDLGMSRFKVARLITHARESGLVTITVRDPASDTRDLAAGVASAFGLRDVAVVAESSGFDSAGAAGAAMLVRHIRPGDLLGIGWGRSVESLVSALFDIAAPTGVDVVQLAGGIVGSGPAFDPSGIAARAASVLGGAYTPLHAPAFLGSAATRRRLLAEPSITAAMQAYERLTIAVVGIGAMGTEPDSALVAGDALPARARKELTARGAAADVVCHFFDVDGRPVTDWESRTVAIPLEQLRQTPVRIGIAIGHSKATAVLAALRAEVINALVTDATCARALLASGA